MNPRKLLKLSARFSDHSEHFAIERNFEEAPGISTLSDEKHLVGAQFGAGLLGEATLTLTLC